MNDQLNILTDAELSAAFAVEVAGMETTTAKGHDELFYIVEKRDGFQKAIQAKSLNFATSMDAVFPYLDKYDYMVSGGRGKSHVQINCLKDGARENGHGWDMSVPRAMCIALIHAKRAEILGPLTTHPYAPLLPSDSPKSTGPTLRA